LSWVQFGPISSRVKKERFRFGYEEISKTIFQASHPYPRKSGRGLSETHGRAQNFRRKRAFIGIDYQSGKLLAETLKQLTRRHSGLKAISP
jgi:hypothetical protein